MGHIQISRLIPAPASEVYQHICDLRHLEMWLAPELEVEWPSAEIPPIRESSEIALYLARFGIATKVEVRVEKVVESEGYSYRQMEGLFRSFVHTQTARAHDDNTTLLSDIVDFTMPLGIIGAILDDLIIRREVEKILNTRLLRIEKYFQRPAR